MDNQKLISDFEDHMKDSYARNYFFNVRKIFRNALNCIDSMGLSNGDLTPDVFSKYVETDEYKSLNERRQRAARTVFRRFNSFKKNWNMKERNMETSTVGVRVEDNPGDNFKAEVTVDDQVRGILDRTIEDVRQKVHGSAGASSSAPLQVVIDSDRVRQAVGEEKEKRPTPTRAKSVASTPTSKPVPKIPTDRQVAAVVPDQEIFRIYKIVDGSLEKLPKDYTYKDFIAAGDFDSLMDKYVRPAFGDCDYALFKFNPKTGAETKIVTITSAKKHKDPEIAKLEDLAKFSENQREQARADAAQRIEEQQKVYDRIMKVLETGGASGGSGSLAKEMVSLTMAGNMVKDLRTPEESDKFMPKIVEVLDRILARVSEPQKAQGSVANDIFQLQMMQDMMKQWRQSNEESEPRPSRFDSPMPMPPLEPRMSKGEEIAAIINAVSSVLPKSQERERDPDALTTKDLLLMMNESSNRMLASQERNSQMLIEMMKIKSDADAAHMKERIDFLERRLTDGSNKGGLTGLAAEFKALQEVNATLGIGQGGGTWMDFVGALPQILDSAGDFYSKVKASSGPNALVERTSTNGSKQESEQTESSPDPNKLIETFGKKLARAIQENSSEECLVAFEYLVRHASKLPQYQPIIAVVFKSDKKELHGYIEQMLQTLYAGQKCPKDVLASLVELLYANRERLQRTVAQ